MTATRWWWATTARRLVAGPAPEEVGRRLATYLQGDGDLMVRTNGWDPAVLERFRADPLGVV